MCEESGWQLAQTLMVGAFAVWGALCAYGWMRGDIRWVRRS